MTEEELKKVPFRETCHMAMDGEYTTTYMSKDAADDQGTQTGGNQGGGSNTGGNNDGGHEVLEG